MAGRIRVGVIGCGLIAQVMHLHYLRELADRFEIAAVCDVSEQARSASAREYGVPEQYESWQDLIARPLDAVLVLTSGSHAPIAIAAARAGLHALVEKPMCFSVTEGREMIAAAEAAGTVLMIAYMKRYDPAYVRLVQDINEMHDLRLVRITTLESPIEPYVLHYNLHRGDPPAKVAAELYAQDEAARLEAALPGADELSRWAYRNILLNSMVHELNAMRGVLGEPDDLAFAAIRETGVTAIFNFGPTQAVMAWVDLPTIARYSMEFAFYSPDRRLTLAFPSPFLRSMPTLLIRDEGVAHSPRGTVTQEIVSFEESFKQELIHFEECVRTGRTPVTSGNDALRDIALCEAVVDVHRSGRPLKRPSEPAFGAAPDKRA